MEFVIKILATYMKAGDLIVEMKLKDQGLY